MFRRSRVRGGPRRILRAPGRAWRLVGLAGCVVLALGLAAALVVPADDRSPSGRPAKHQHPRYVDYLPAGRSVGPDQCSLPVDQRTGGWVCP